MGIGGSTDSKVPKGREEKERESRAERGVGERREGKKRKRGKSEWVEEGMERTDVRREER